jgi:DNA-binding CsgD family transcriptional regulator
VSLAIMDMRDRLLGLIQDLYSAPGSQDGWTPFLERLCDTTGGYTAQFISVDRRGRAGLALAVRADPAARAAYDGHFGALDPWGHSPRLQRAHAGEVILGEEMVPHPEFQRTAYYADFARPFDVVRCIAATIEVAPTLLSVITIARTEAHSPFGTEDCALLDALMPHLQRALQLHRRITVAEAASNDFAGVLEGSTRAVLLVNAAAQVIWMNRAAERIIAARDGLMVDAGELRAARGVDTTRLRTLLAEAAATSTGQGTGAGGALTLGRIGRRPLMALVAPLPARPAFFSGIGPAAAIVIVTDPERAPILHDETLRMLFGLTAGEAALTHLLAQGETLAEAAARLGLRINTLRTRLKTIFEKTGTHSQADLIRLVLLGATPL